MAEKYIQEYFTDAQGLGVRPATIHPKATENMQQIIDMVQTLIDKGILTKEQAHRHPKKNTITRALGVDETVECDIFLCKLAKGERLLLCTDGLTNLVTDEEILKTAQAHKSPEELCRKLIDQAMEAGATDNVTAVVLTR